MPIYEYRCLDCSALNDFFMKMDAPAPTVCPACKQEVVMTKKVSASAFQLKGTGWYATDFKDKKPNQPSGASDNLASNNNSDSKTAGSSAGESAPKNASSNASDTSSSTSSASAKTK